jgi:hypothetical protein
MEHQYAALKKQYDEQEKATAIANQSLQVGDFAGKWSGTLMRGGQVSLDIKSDGTVIWSVPSIARDTETAVSHIEKAGESYVVSIQNQQVRMTLSTDRRTLRLSGGGMDTTLTRKA